MSHFDHTADEHDLGFAHDLPRLVGRRRLLSLLAGGGLAAVAGPAAALDCVALPWETAGPYPADGTNAKAGQTVNALSQAGVIREDLRPSFAALTPVAEGVQLDLALTLQDANGCTPLRGHAIYIWHCDTTGLYSLYDTPEANYLRGVGVTDETGKVSFTTIVPGCYDGRWPHIHFEIFETIDSAVAGTASVLTAQIAIPEVAAAAVYAADARYANGTRNLGRITIPTDNVFRDNSTAELAQQTLNMTGSPHEGYQGRLTIPVDFTAARTGAMPPMDGFGDRMPPPAGFDGTGGPMMPPRPQEE